MSELPEDIDAYLAERLHAVLPDNLRPLLAGVARLANAEGWSAYLVGGYVRDALLGRADYDADVSVVGDATLLAERLALESGAALETHGAFGTATVTPPGSDFHLDLVTARKERYERPGALPTVEPGTIIDDLVRRDFTVNAMATELLPGGFGPLLDPHGGVADLRSHLIRVLHAGSFTDDPTRILRAVRLAHRLGFTIELGTLELILRAVRDGALYTVSTERLVHELILIMETPGADAMLVYLDKLGVLSAIHPDLAWHYRPGEIAPVENDALSASARRDTYLAILGAEFAPDPEEAAALARALRLDARSAGLMRGAAELAAVWTRLAENADRPSQIAHLLSDIDPTALEAYARIGAVQRDDIPYEGLRRYLDEWRHVKPEIGGDRLKNLGLAPGPLYRELLGELRKAKLDGLVPTRADEERWVREWLARH